MARVSSHHTSTIAKLSSICLLQCHLTSYRAQKLSSKHSTSESLSLLNRARNVEIHRQSSIRVDTASKKTSVFDSNSALHHFRQEPSNLSTPTEKDHLVAYPVGVPLQRKEAMTPLGSMRPFHQGTRANILVMKQTSKKFHTISLKPL